TFDSSGTRRLNELYQEVMAFFALDTQTKLRYSVPSRINGYRPFAYAHSAPETPDIPDLNDCFLYWPHRRESLPYYEEIQSLVDACEAFRQTFATIISGLIDELRKRYNYADELPFEKGSVLQINAYDKAV